MEYVCNNQSSIATKIFELGLKAFPEEVALAVKFLQFQLQINDEPSQWKGAFTVRRDRVADIKAIIDARALFERLILKFTPDKARPIWELWAKHEYTYGDLAACQKMEARFAEAYPSGKSIAQ
jgi:cleavage stimulation factor subunit 3